jgi:hypothetical protein
VPVGNPPRYQPGNDSGSDQEKYEGTHNGCRATRKCLLVENSVSLLQPEATPCILTDEAEMNLLYFHGVTS